MAILPAAWARPGGQARSRVKGKPSAKAPKTTATSKTEPGTDARVFPNTTCSTP